MQKNVMTSWLTLALFVSIFSSSVLAIPESPNLHQRMNGSVLEASWSSSPGANGYRLYYAPHPYTGPDAIESMNLGKLNHFSLKLWRGATYYFAIAAYDNEGEGPLSNVQLFNMNTPSFGTHGATPPMSVSGALEIDTAEKPFMLYLDDSKTPLTLNQQNRFMIDNVSDGSHSLFLHIQDDSTVEIPFRMSAGRGLDFGNISITNGEFTGFSGFNGYHFGFIDEDGDGINDNFTDADGNGICDLGRHFAGQPYFMNMGFVDADGDGINDLFRDSNGDGVNDVTNAPFSHGFGWIDDDGNGINDRFVDGNGDGICDLSGMPFQQPFGWSDMDNDGVNDRFLDSNGDGINDISGRPYVTIPGWSDMNLNGVNDFFADANGDGLNDLDNRPIHYGHGFGWIDENDDGINDLFTDENGDGINDLATGPFAGQRNCFGFQATRLDANGDGIDDETGQSFGHGFGWVDNNGDGINDIMGNRYSDGYQSHQNFRGWMNTPFYDRSMGIRQGMRRF